MERRALKHLKNDDKEVEKDLEEYEEEITDKELEESTASSNEKKEKIRYDIIWYFKQSI